MSKTTAKPRATKKYRALIAAGVSDERALEVLGVAEPKVDERVTQLVEAGFSEDEAKAILSASEEQGEVEDAPAPQTAKQRAEALVEEKGFGFTKGRVYVNEEILAAAVRVRRTGTPEVAATSGVGRVAGVLIYREDSGDVAIQNLVRA